MSRSERRIPVALGGEAAAARSASRGPRPDNPFTPFARSAIEQSLSARFEEQARLHPARLAVKSGSDAWSYATLDRRANGIAAAILAARGERAEPVAILLEQGAPLVAAILGALKAGKIYVPLDPAFPPARLAELLDDCRAALIVAGPATRSIARAAAPPRAEVILATPADGAVAERPAISVGADAGAYIYYTSGSTGRPKGVLDIHRNVLHNVFRYTNSLRVTPEDRLTLLQGPGFSGAVSSMFAAVLNGAAVFPFDVAKEGADRIAGWLRSEEITIYHSVPSLFRAVATGERFPALRLIRLEGDRASARDVELFRSRFAPPCILVNGLGATECGIVRQYFIGIETPVPDGVVPIGDPVEDMDVILLDESGAEIGHGEVGQIAVRSRYLAAGYWGRDDLTAAAFAADLSDPTRRVYLTGDLGRFRADGCLEHLGRTDSQIKIRGNRVEAAEVEAALLATGMLRETTVVTRHDEAEPRLVAYVVPGSGASPTVSALRRCLAERLPDYMIPSIFVAMDALPLNANRKVDRRALPAPDGRRPLLDDAPTPSTSLLQRQLVQIWEDVLEVRPVGVRDSFFDLGGSSLLAMRMMDRVERTLGRRIPLSVMLAGATVERLAEAIQAEAVDLRAPVVPVQPDGCRPPIFFLHGDYLSGGLFCTTLARHLGQDQPFYAIPPCGLDGQPVPRSYGAMARRHLEGILSVKPRGPYRLGGLCNGGLVAFEIARLLEAKGEVVDFLAPVAAAAFDRPGGWRSRAARLAALAASQGRNRLRALLSRPAALCAAPPSGSERSAPETPEARRSRLRETYLRIDRRYVPGRYAGRVTLVWPSEDPLGPAEAAISWRRLAARVDLHVVPGTHVSCLTDHARSAAALLSRCLSELDTPDPFPPARSVPAPGGAH